MRFLRDWRICWKQHGRTFGFRKWLSSKFLILKNILMVILERLNFLWTRRAQRKSRCVGDQWKNHSESLGARLAKDKNRAEIFIQRGYSWRANGSKFQWWDFQGLGIVFLRSTYSFSLNIWWRLKTDSPPETDPKWNASVKAFAS